MVAAVDLHALKDAAIHEFDFADAEVGDGLEFVLHVPRQAAEPVKLTVLDGFVLEPFPDPAGFEGVVIEPADVNGVLAAAMGAVIIFVP